MKRVACLAALLLLAGCGPQSAREGVLQTKLPGHVTAGGLSSGEVMARAGRGSVEPGPAGTPGIPQGAGGNTSGAALGGTTPAAPPGTSAAANAAAMPASAAQAAASAPAGAASAPALSDAERQARSLAVAMDAVAARWRARATRQGQAVNAPVPVEAGPGFQAQANLSGPSGQPQGTLSPAAAQLPIRSEKHGTAPPSPDVKTGAKPKTNPVLDPKSPEAAGR